jgi:superkiller protein 3
MSKSVSRPNSRLILGGKVALLAALIGVAVYLWTAPMRAERALRNASFEQLLAASKREPDNPRVFYHLGVRLRDLAQTDLARAAFARAAELDRDNPEAWLAWAAAAGRAGKSDEAYSALTTLVQNHPKNPRARFVLVTFLQENYALQKAFDEAAALTALTPTDPKAWWLQGVIALQLSDYAQAEAALQRAVALAPKDWKAQLALGNALASQKKFEEALPSLEAAARLAPNEVQPASALGRALLKRARTPADMEAAQAVLLKAVALDPSAASAQLALGKTYVAQRRWPLAKGALEQSARTDPRNPQTHFELARVYAQLGEREASAREKALHQKLQAFEQRRLQLGIQARATNDPHIRLELARLYAENGEVGDALVQYRTLLVSHPQLAEAKRELAALERRVAVVSPARPSLAVASEPVVRPDAPPEDLLRDAQSMMDRGYFRGAERAYRSVLAKAPRSAAAAEGLGLALDRQGRRDEAFAVLRQVLEQDANRTKARFALAKIYFDNRFPDTAARHIEVLLRGEPDNPLYLFALSECYRDNPAKKLEAYALLRRAVSFAPSDPVYRLGLAKAAEALQKSDEAETNYRQALEAAPDNPSALLDFGTFLLNYRPTLERCAEAETLLQRCLAQQPRNAHALLGLGRAAILRDEPKAALKPLQEAVTYAPGLPEGWYHLARVYDRLKQPDDAKKCRAMFQEVSAHTNELSNTEEQARLNMKDPALRLKLARLYIKSEKYTSALVQYYAYLSMKPDDTAAREEANRLIANLKAAGKMPSETLLKTLLVVSTKKSS